MDKYSAKAIANAFLGLARRECSEIQPMKIQKLVYLAHGWNLGIYKSPLLGEEVQAWQYGPVISSLYHEFKNYGSGMISGDATNYELDEKTLKINTVAPAIPASDTQSHRLIEQVWSKYKHLSGIQLSSITHQDGTPWSLIFRGHHSSSIPDALIQSHYEDLIRTRVA
jgi:uncharacterized phage-associated protein